MKITAIVPMRHDSERLPGKNYRPFRGEPLYRHIVRELASCARVTEIVIDTDSPVITADARAQFPQVRVLARPPELRDGSIGMNTVLLNTVKQCDADLYLQTHSTNPLLRSASIERAVDAYLDGRPAHDSLFSVTRLQTRLWSHDSRPLNHDPKRLLRTQDLLPVWEENSCLYLFTRELLERTGSRVGERPLLFALERREAWDIDELVDFDLAEALAAVPRA
jgi:CMP-N-acetylneuraminic acid synthetase